MPFPADRVPLSPCFKPAPPSPCPQAHRAVGPRPASIGPYTIPAGTPVALPLFAIHNTIHNWEQPERFAPERWLEVGSEERLRTVRTARHLLPGWSCINRPCCASTSQHRLCSGHRRCSCLHTAHALHTPHPPPATCAQVPVEAYVVGHMPPLTSSRSPSAAAGGVEGVEGAEGGAEGGAGGGSAAAEPAGPAAHEEQKTSSGSRKTVFMPFRCGALETWLQLALCRALPPAPTLIRLLKCAAFAPPVQTRCPSPAARPRHRPTAATVPVTAWGRLWQRSR